MNTSNNHNIIAGKFAPVKLTALIVLLLLLFSGCVSGMVSDNATGAGVSSEDEAPLATPEGIADSSADGTDGATGAGASGAEGVPPSTPGAIDTGGMSAPSAKSAAATAPEDAEPNGAAPENAAPAKVTRVVDGDTIVVSLNGASEKVRLIGIDTPESVHPDESKNVPYGKVATAFTKEHLDGEDVLLEFDVQERDKYGRLLAYIYVGGKMFNRTLVEQGHAKLATYPPNVKYASIFTAAQTKARESGKGLWGYDESTTPPAPTLSVENAETANAAYIGTTNSHKFHTRDCKWGKKITENNAAYFKTREEAITEGFMPCKVCNP